MQKLYELTFLIGWKVGFSAGVVWKENMVDFWVENKSVLGKSRDGFVSRLQWKKWKPRDGFRKLGVSNYKSL